ncbi:hypothetical protein HY497_00195 [Candidatus Woesearchaeota archaeon]|nr:hypothetical protein [Candidatus Woesearchaeota archaeon]
MTAIEAGTGSERLSIEFIISEKGCWEAYVRMVRGNDCTTVVQSKDAMVGWKNNSQGSLDHREPLEERTARAFYDAQLTRAREAVKNRTASFPYEEPLITGQVLGKSFRVPRP